MMMSPMCVPLVFFGLFGKDGRSQCPARAIEAWHEHFLTYLFSLGVSRYFITLRIANVRPAIEAWQELPDLSLFTTKWGHLTNS